VIPLLAKKSVRYQVLSRTRVGRAHLEWWGGHSSEKLLAKYFGEQSNDIGQLTV
jgi:hypothetical protein